MPATKIAEKQGRVLCVDDEPGILRSLQWLLQRDFDVTTCASAQEALPLLATGDFDVVISDQRMPGMTGVEFLRRVRDSAPRAMRLLLTGYSDAQAILRSVNDSEIFRFIHKPWNPDALRLLVAQAARIAREQPAATIPQPPPAANGASDTEVWTDSVLVIDEDTEVAEQLAHVVGGGHRVAHARSLGEAVGAIRDGHVGIIVAATQLGGVDITRLIKMLKREYPEIVSLLYTDATDGVDVITLINQGQIFRFLPKPIKPATLRLALSAALAKRHQLRQRPGLGVRHEVEGLSEAEQRAMISQIERATLGPRQRKAAGTVPLWQRIGGSIRRLLSAS
jgi:serine/threonine-protein kinase